MKKILIIGAFFILVFTGCDQIRGILGMATSEDIEKAKIELMQKEAREKMIRDSLAVLDSLAKLAIDTTAQIEYVSNLDKRYYIIVGSFKEEKNVGSMIQFLEKQGYKPAKIALKNGYDMVALCGYDSFRNANEEIAKIEMWEVCPYDAWIYDVRQQKHK